MAIGLTSEELVTTFFKCLVDRMNEATTEFTVVDAGLNPALQQMLDQLKTALPQLTRGQFTVICIILKSFTDTIARNNESLARTIPHIDL